MSPLPTNSSITYFLKNEIQDSFEQEQDDYEDDLDDLIEIPIGKRIKVE